MPRIKTIKDTLEQDRPREKISRLGPQSLKNRELIAAIIGRGIPGRDVNAIASDIEKVLDETDGKPDLQDLLNIGGMGLSKASQIVAAFELFRRYSDEKIIKVTCPEDVLPAVNYLKGKTQEYFICMTLNGAGEIIKDRIITVGLLNHSPVHPREVFADAITDRCASVILVHNHPSGNPEPSSQDIDVTKRLCEAGGILGIEVLDHLIVANRGYVSFKKRGLI
ncbi:DNA repair protein RadC [Methanomicrobium antiquum]|uniref:DNA repair protein RadC n=1 Tax=Methanomicrobium antiquum TaxID=487686 RepID=A0AAF0FVW0_9EURY|nr:DNA repair protein RadC [Methanomicrobium antiquum]MDD3976762.1 DNA repair protein RadC [Methanomicrobium sp.]WFN36875.1 DNA repair protein RadC [Methanomicrobium antiquum]